VTITADYETAEDRPVRPVDPDTTAKMPRGFLRIGRYHVLKTLGEGGTLYLELESLDIQQSTTPGNEILTMMMRGKIRNLEFAGLLKNEVRATELFSNADFVGAIPPVGDNLYQFTMKATKGGRQN